MSQVKMQNINLVNEEMLNHLTKYIDCCEKWKEKGLFRDESRTYGGGSYEGATNDDYMWEIIRQGEKHDGFPQKSHMWTVGINKESKITFTKDELEFRSEARPLVDEFTAIVGASRNALTAHYPPGGFIGWHNNANAYGYNLILTWSETGDGWFDYFDLEKQERVRIPDKKGWNAKMGYFGGYHEPDKLFYHAAGTQCKRYTLSWVFNEEEEWWKYAIEDMETP